MIGAQASTQAAQAMHSSWSPSRMSIRVGQTRTQARQSMQSASRRSSYATTSVCRSKRTPCTFAYGQTVAQKVWRTRARSRKRTTEAPAHAQPTTGPSVPAPSRAKKSYGETKNQTRSAPATTDTATVIPKPAARRQGRPRGAGSIQRVSSPSTVCGQPHPHQTRPKSTVTSRNSAVRRRIAARTTKASSTAKEAPKAWSRPAGTSSRRALSPPIRRNGSPRKTSPCSPNASQRHVRSVTGGRRPSAPSRPPVRPLAPLVVVILQHLVLRTLDAVAPPARVVEDDDTDERGAERQPEAEVGRLAGQGVIPSSGSSAPAR